MIVETMHNEEFLGLYRKWNNITYNWWVDSSKSLIMNWMPNCMNHWAIKIKGRRGWGENLISYQHMPLYIHIYRGQNVVKWWELDLYQIPRNQRLSQQYDSEKEWLWIKWVGDEYGSGTHLDHGHKARGTQTK